MANVNGYDTALTELKNAILAHVPNIVAFNTTAKDFCDASDIIKDGNCSEFCC